MFFPPDHAESRIVIGVEVTHFLQVGRRGAVLCLSLGRPPGLQVTLEMPCPEAPGCALAAMRKVPDGSAVWGLPDHARYHPRLRRGGGGPVSDRRPPARRATVSLCQIGW